MLSRSFLCALFLGPIAGSATAQTLLYTLNGDKANDRLGVWVASAGDVNGDGKLDFIAGAPEDANPFTPGEGYARVYSGLNGATLFTFDGATITDMYGWSVGAAGDVNHDNKSDLVIGAPGAASQAGVTYIRSGATGAVLFTFTGAAAGDMLGTSVAGCGDVNNDGYADVIAGGPTAAAGGMNRGTARVFSGKTGAILWTINGTANDARLGTSVDGCGDVNGDGYADFIIGSIGAGAKIYSGKTGLVLQSFSAPATDRLGSAVAGVGDLDGDGFPDVIVGAPQDGNIFTPGNGYAKVYSGATGALILTLTGLNAGDRFGCAVGNARDINGDGRTELIVGADQYTFSSAGYAQVFNGANGNVIYSFTGSGGGDRFGYSVDGLGDVNLDGNFDFAIGALNHTSNGALPTNGQVQVWSQSAGCPTPTTYCSATNNSSGGPALMSYSGTTSIAANDFVAHVSGAPANKLALFAYSPNQGNTPAGNGFLCLSSPVVRLPAFTTSGTGSGAYALDYNNLPPAGPIGVGSVENFILWFRDPPAGGANFNFSNGLHVTFCP